MIDLAHNVINNGLTKVSIERFEMIHRHSDIIKQLSGDVVECGVWKGGMGVFLSKLFDEKQIWLADSFKGFENPDTSKYSYSGERHREGGMAVPYNNVTEVFKKYNCTNINTLVGFVNETLPAAKINEIALLRIDVDAYSATHEVLDHLYSKVVPGGYIIFDDTCLVETRSAILNFFKINNIEIKLKNPQTDNDVIFTDASQDLPCGCYIIKE
jgi:hypothetical protein